MAEESPTYLQQFAAVGGLGSLVALLGWLTGRGARQAEARKTNAEAGELEANRGAEFEKAVNERVQATFTDRESQVEQLTALVQTLIGLNKTQGERITALEKEVDRLRKALDTALHHVRLVNEQCGACPRKPLVAYNTLVSALADGIGVPVPAT